MSTLRTIPADQFAVTSYFGSFFTSFGTKEVYLVKLKTGVGPYKGSPWVVVSRHNLNPKTAEGVYSFETGWFNNRKAAWKEFRQDGGKERAGSLLVGPAITAIEI
jgi:hypothetical protein